MGGLGVLLPLLKTIDDRLHAYGMAVHTIIDALLEGSFSGLDHGRGHFLHHCLKKTTSTYQLWPVRAAITPSFRQSVILEHIAIV
jgi:hypothetical protein